MMKSLAIAALLVQGLCAWSGEHLLHSVSALSTPSAKAHVPRAFLSNSSISNTTPLPNPYIESDFQAPKYELDDLAVWSATKVPGMLRYDKGWEYLTLTLRDVANNYTLFCNMSSYFVGDDWSTESCVLALNNGPPPLHPRALTFLNGLEPQRQF